MLAKFKPYARYLILGGTLFFLAHSFAQHWQEVKAIHLTPITWLYLGASFTASLTAHLWAGWVWTWLLELFGQIIPKSEAMRVYLLTNMAKYLPGNIWHFYGRMNFIKQNGGSLGTATLAVMLEPLLMAAVAIVTATLSFNGGRILILQLLGLASVLMGIHPIVLNTVISKLARFKGAQEAEKIEVYPWLPLLGEWIFLLLKASGFLLALAAFVQFNHTQVLHLLGVFSFAWLLGLVIPGAPGGLGVFEASLLATINPEYFPVAPVLTAVAIFRVLSILAEAIPAAAVYFRPVKSS